MPSRLKPTWSDVLILVLGYVGLDWASYIHPLHGLNITPWNPAPALGVLVLLRLGRIMAAPLALSIIAGDVWVRGLPESILPPTVPRTPMPVLDSKPSALSSVSLRSRAAVTMACASGCSLPWSRLAASRSTSSPG